jgi:hypothetical protein
MLARGAGVVKGANISQDFVSFLGSLYKIGRGEKFFAPTVGWA